MMRAAAFARTTALNSAGGPGRPQPGSVPPPSRGLPRRLLPAGLLGPPWWFVGCHGGAGASTLTSMTPAADAGRYWPQPPAPAVSQVVLVARTHASGLRSAQEALAQWASGALEGDVRLLGLAAVADAPGRLPRPLRDLLRLISGGVPRLWELPWVEALRLGDPPEQVSLPGSFAALAADLDQITSGGSHVHGTRGR